MTQQNRRCLSAVLGAAVRRLLAALCLLGTEAGFVSHLEQSIKDAPLNENGHISRHTFFTDIYDPARGKN